MKIGIFTTILDRADWSTGVPTYGYKLVEYCQKVVQEDEIYLVHRNPNDDDIYEGANEIIVPAFSLPPLLRGFVTRLFRTPKFLRDEEIDVIHLLAPTVPEMISLFPSGMKKVLTVHDLFIFTQRNPFSLRPSKFKAWFKQALRRWILLLVKNRVNMFIAVSQNTKDDMVECLEIPEEKIKVVYEATEKKVEEEEKLPVPDFAEPPYITGFPPTEELLNIFKELKEKGIKEKLVLFGRDKWLQRAEESAEENNLKDHIIITGFISQEELIKLYANAKLLISHVEYEGFGLPPLEAISCGCPVIGSDVSAVPEVVGDAGILLKPYKREKWVDAAYKVLTNKELRQDLIEKAWRQASKFSWEKTAKETLEVYRQLS